ncbi:hypothetical protein M011DRAFT_394297 [Sporormia fimetaria CBS 119925]|uniref:PH domain-containing protein n=1 Tax=Sporormia fimetaria CBS 119925 TaxID=1340428 RepID=A0A6A6VML5_9PLEO|nr:hypothetical protein M011DRAFT_394297 [Sporormia fimetaria CBS 119925]
MSAVSDTSGPAPGDRTESTPRSRNQRSNNADRAAPTYGYHNTFHTHAPPAPTFPPPTYAVANSEQTLKRQNNRLRDQHTPCSLPAYTCTVQNSGQMGLKMELTTPFQISPNRDWHDTWVVLQGTQLSVYRLKTPGTFSKSKTVGPGRLVRQFSLQHAEVGLAADFKKSIPQPKSTFAHLMPTAARKKLFETDPQLFEPMRDHVLRLRLETEQFLLSASSQEDMLDWVECLCAAIDISPPLEDRSEPRYRSLPRRNRRQRALDGGGLPDLEQLSAVEGGRMIIAEQERIIRRLYPHLAAPSSHSPQDGAHSGPDPETEDLDPEDVRFPPVPRNPSHNSGSDERPSSSATTDSASPDDPKARPPHTQNPAQALRYRRRCAPVLLASSPRVSDVVFSGGKRMRIVARDRVLVRLQPLPPRYDAHNFPKKSQLPVIDDANATQAAGRTKIVVERPAAPARGVSDDSILSFGYELQTSGSEAGVVGSESDDARNEEPESPTVAILGKGKKVERLVVERKRMDERRESGEGLSAVAMTVGLLI